MEHRTTKQTGDEGEERAANFLQEKGYKITARKWRTREGEIDIIAEKDDYLVFVEVKTLPNATYDMLKKVLNSQKQQRIVKTSKCFLLNHREYISSYIRYDVIVLDMQGLPSVYHIENAFSEE